MVVITTGPPVLWQAVSQLRCARRPVSQLSFCPIQHITGISDSFGKGLVVDLEMFLLFYPFVQKKNHGCILAFRNLLFSSEETCFDLGYPIFLLSRIHFGKVLPLLFNFPLSFLLIDTVVLCSHMNFFKTLPPSYLELCYSSMH